MDIIFDSCSLINLINGEILDEVLSIPGNNYFIGQIVYEECSQIGAQKLIIDHAIAGSTLSLIPYDVELNEFLLMKNRFQLGDGETESIIHAKSSGNILSSDDHKARSNGLIALGKGQVIGSLYLIRELVRQQIILCDEARLAYIIMKTKGGFLPNVDESYLCQ